MHGLWSLLTKLNKVKSLWWTFRVRREDAAMWDTRSVKDIHKLFRAGDKHTVSTAGSSNMKLKPSPHPHPWKPTPNQILFASVNKYAQMYTGIYKTERERERERRKKEKREKNTKQQFWQKFTHPKHTQLQASKYSNKQWKYSINNVLCNWWKCINKSVVSLSSSMPV